MAQLITIAEETDPVLAPHGGAHLVARAIDAWLTQPLLEAIRCQAINSMSFRFQIQDERWVTASGAPLTTDMAIIRELEKTWEADVPDAELPPADAQACQGQ